MSLAEQKIVITGGGSGIGAAIAHELARQGSRLVIAGRSPEKLEAVAGEFPEQISTVRADVGDRESVRQLIATARDRLGQVDVLINAAGINVPQRMMHNLSPEDWDRMMTINATGPYNCMREVLPEMRERQAGTIINISSVAGVRAAALGGVGYNASKFAATGLGLSVGDEEKEHGIRVTNIYPGEVDTPILEQRPSPITEEHRARILQPNDVAAAVLMVLQLPARARVPELTILPTTQSFV